MRASPFVPSYTILNRTPVLLSFSRKPPPLRNSQCNSLSLDSTLPRLVMANVSSEFSQASCTVPPHEPFVQDFRQVKGRFSLVKPENENPPVVLLSPHDLRRQVKHSPRSFRFDAAGRPPQWEPSDIEGMGDSVLQLIKSFTEQ